jgi:hypothetical protein
MVDAICTSAASGSSISARRACSIASALRPTTARNHVANSARVRESSGSVSIACPVTSLEVAIDEK